MLNQLEADLLYSTFTQDQYIQYYNLRKYTF